MIGFTYDEDFNLIADRDMDLIVWAYAVVTCGADGTAAGIGFFKNGTEMVGLASVTGMTEGDVQELEIVNEDLVSLASGDKLEIRGYSDDPSISWSEVRVVIAEAIVDVDEEQKFGSAWSFNNRARFTISSGERPAIVPRNAGNNENFLLFSRDGSAYQQADSAIFSSWRAERSIFDGLALLTDEKPSGTDGGTFSSSGWITRDLNVEVDLWSFVDLSSNQFTLPPGNYFIEADAPAYQVGGHQLRIQNITDDVTEIVGGSGLYTDTGRAAATREVLDGFLGVSDASKAFELQHHCQFGEADDGLGLASEVDAAIPEVYARVKIYRLVVPAND